MTEYTLQEALDELRQLVNCRCHPAFKDRGLQDPQCQCDYADVVEAVAAHAEAMTAKLATCEKYRDAYAECDRIGTQAVRDLEAKLAKAVEIGNKMAHSIEGNYYLPNIAGEWRKVAAEIKGESHE